MFSPSVSSRKGKAFLPTLRVRMNSSLTPMLVGVYWSTVPGYPTDALREPWHLWGFCWGYSVSKMEGAYFLNTSVARGDKYPHT